MDTQKKLRLSGQFTRLPQADIDAFNGLPVGWISDALDRQAALPHLIKPVTQKTEFAGSALTVETPYNDNLAVYAALSIARPGDVLVIAIDDKNSATPSCSLCGDILAGFAKNAGIVAIVTNGLVRDKMGLDNVNIPVFAAGLSPNAPAKEGPGSCGLDIRIGGRVIASGDLICGDDDGIVHIARAQIEQTRKGLVAVANKEQQMDKALQTGAPQPDWLKARLAEEDIDWQKD